MKPEAENKSRFQIIYLVTFFALVLSKGLALVPGMALDDYSALHQDRNLLFYLSQGRFVQAGLQVLLTHLGLSPTAIAWPVILLFFCFAALAITFGILYVAKDKGHVLGLAAVGAVMVCHPYLAEYFSFRESLITQGCSFALMALVFFATSFAQTEGPVRAAKRWAFTLLAVVTMVLLAGTQQTAFIILGFFILARCSQEVLDKEWSRKSDGTRMLGLYVLSIVAYVIVYALIRKSVGAQDDSRSSFIAFSDLGARLDLMRVLSKKLLLLGEPTLSAGVKGYILAIYLLFLVFVGGRKPAALVLIAALSLVFYGGSIFLVSVSGVWWPVPRAVYGLGFALGISLLMVYLNAAGWLSRPFPTLVFIAAIGLSFHSTVMLNDQLRLNRWDAWTASSIAQDLRAAKVKPDQKVVLVGAGWSHPLRLPTADGDLNLSALAVPWAANHLFMETTGRSWRVDSVANAPECQGVAFWPADGAIKPVGEAVYVCMGSR